MNIWSDEVVKLIEHSVNDFDKQMSLLVLKSGRHQQWKDLVEQCISTKFSSFVSDLTQGRLQNTKISQYSKVLSCH